MFHINCNTTVTISETSGTSTTVSKIATPSKASVIVKANVTTNDNKTHEVSCTVTYTETTIQTINVKTESVTVAPSETATIEVEGLGRLGSKIALTGSEGITYTSNAAGIATVATATNGNGTVTGVAAGTTYITVSCSGKTVTYNGENSGSVGVTVKKVLENAIDLGTDINGSGVTTDDWVLLYDGTGSTATTIGGYVYCILADYLPNTNSAISNSGLNAVSGKTYSVNIPSGSGNAYTLVAALNHSTAWNPLISSTYSSISGATVRGSIPKTEMDLIKAARTPQSYYLAESASSYNTHKCYGYWLASANYGNYVYYVHFSGDTGNYYYYREDIGVCPVVKIPASAITLNKVNNVWKISVNS